MFFVFAGDLGGYAIIFVEIHFLVGLFKSHRKVENVSSKKWNHSLFIRKNFPLLPKPNAIPCMILAHSFPHARDRSGFDLGLLVLYLI